ncbi:MAG: hypothetical protein OQK32_03490 [Gammaproteobacteria bacterium]|nr:hypothetical protein [Gammaproteobacteria bacterium]MCW8922564.1 hypothetical protein [Gammaproteobacteria bacterium]
MIALLLFSYQASSEIYKWVDDKANTLFTYDVEKSSIGRRDYKALRGTSVPIIIIGKKRMNGFTAARFDNLYKKQLQLEAAAAHPDT